MTNVLKFKKSKNVLPTTDEEAAERIKEVRVNYAKAVATELTTLILNNLVGYGYKIELEEGYLKDIVMVNEVLIATMLRYSNIEHFLQKVIDDVVDLEDEESGISDILKHVEEELYPDSTLE